jgi:hypothetical protein
MENTLMKDILNVEPIILKEYGRNIQNIVNYILTIEDKDRRSQFAKTLIELMRQINPSMRDAQDSYHKIWDHLYIMSDFKLDVDSPYPKPEMSIFDKKPMRVDYNMHLLYYKHYGRNIELLISKAIELKDKEEQDAAILYIGRLMKRFYASWNKENIDDAVIVEHLHQMSKNKLRIDVEKVKAEGLFDSPREKESTYKEYKEYKDYKSGNTSMNGGGNRNKGNNKNNSNRPQDKRKRI